MMVENTPEKAKRRTSDDIIRTIIFFFATSMAIVFLLGYNNIIAVIAALVFMIVGGQNMRTAWVPYGKIVESAFWFFLSGVGLIVALLFRALGQQEATTIVPLMAFLLLFSLYDTYRSIQRARRFLRALEQQQQHHTDPPRP